jgi:hypothetical protein
MATKTLYMENTAIDPTRTAGEIVSELVRNGATSINTDYDGGKVVGRRWIMRVNGEDVLFQMPVRVEPVFKVLNGRRLPYSRTSSIAKDREQAERVAWRQLLRWVQAQNAMIETGMVQAAEVYLPYMVVHASGQTLFQRMSESRFKMLAAATQ